MAMVRGRGGVRHRVPSVLPDRVAFAVVGAVVAAAFVAYFTLIAVVVVQARGGAL